MFIALELNEDGTLNDEGCIADTPAEAWDMVKDVFYAPCTVIAEVKPALSVKVPKQVKPIFSSLKGI